MNINRKLQVAAGIVIVNGTLALSLLTSEPALASGCVPRFVCVTGRICSQLSALQRAQDCAKPGCTYSSSSCSNNCTGWAQLFCVYQ